MQIATALNNLALAATNDNATINVLVESNKQMAALLTALSAKIDNIGTTGAQPAPVSVATPRTPLTKAQKLERYNPNEYCWLHGHMVHKSHTSATCKTKKEGHTDGATCTDTMGGKQYKKSWETK